MALLMRPGENLSCMANLHSQQSCLSVALDDDVWSDTFFDERPRFSHHFTSEQDDRCSAVTDLSVLCAGDIDKSLGGRVNNIEKLV